ncbi:hypothetical protein [Kitasatospora sp. McL0602]|uniref:hypothetical protein n=1 Tax=Kitasatospora sp. McL0602 TaxID=3439530 RepID=UPI003F893F23
MSAAVHAERPARVSARDSAANDLRAALRALGISVIVQGGPDVFEESGISWVALASHLKEEEAALIAATLRKGMS